MKGKFFVCGWQFGMLCGCIRVKCVEIAMVRLKINVGKNNHLIVFE